MWPNFLSEQSACAALGRCRWNVVSTINGVFSLSFFHSNLVTFLLFKYFLTRLKMLRIALIGENFDHFISFRNWNNVKNFVLLSNINYDF